MKRVALVTAALVAAVAVWGASLPPRRMSLPIVLEGRNGPRGAARAQPDVGRARHPRRHRGGRRTRRAPVRRRHRPWRRHAHARAAAATDPACWFSTPWKSARAAATTWRSDFRSRHTRSAARLRTSSRTSDGWVASASPRILIRPRTTCAGLTGQRPIDALRAHQPRHELACACIHGRCRARSWLLLRVAARLSGAARGVDRAAAHGPVARSREQWMTLAAQRPIVALAGADAHAKLAFRDTEPGDNRYSIPIPSYESSFESLSVHVRTERPFSGDAAADAEALLRGIRGGAVYVAVDGWATPAAFEFTATSGATTRVGGQHPRIRFARHASRSQQRPGRLSDDGLERERAAVRSGLSPSSTCRSGSSPGVYRVESGARLRAGVPPGSRATPSTFATPVPDRREVPAPVARIARGGVALRRAHHLRLVLRKRSHVVVSGGRRRTWSMVPGCASATGCQAVRRSGSMPPLRCEYRHGVDGGGRGRPSRFAPKRPMRISVQVRAEVAGAPPERWERSVYVNVQEQDRTVRFADMIPVGHHARRTGHRRPTFAPSCSSSTPRTPNRARLAACGSGTCGSCPSPRHEALIRHPADGSRCGR